LADIVNRVAKITGTPKLDLRRAWNAEVERALSRNDGEFDTRCFILAAKRFLERTGATLPSVSAMNRLDHENTRSAT